MSKLLINLALLQTKAIVNVYTWTTLPFYTALQRPWRRLKLSKSTAVQATTDKQGRVIYSRSFPQKENHPYFKCSSFPEILPQLDPNRPIIGVRDVVREELAFDSEGKSVKVDGKVLKKVQLAQEYRWSTVKQVMERVDNIAKGLKQIGVKKEDKVAVYAENGVEWMYVCLALMRLNAVTVTLYSTLGDSGVIWGINQSEPKYVITSQSLLGKLNSLSDQIQHLNTIIYIPDGNTKSSDDDSEILKLQTKGFQIHNYEQLEYDGENLPEHEFQPPKPQDTAVIMYTSGTTGNPKGVVINHSQLYAAFLNLFRIDLENDGMGMNAAAFAAYLPMAHIFGYLLNMTMFVSNSKLAFCSPLTLLDSSPAHVPGQIGDIKLIRPEFLIVVPLVLERILKEIYQKLNERSALAAPLFNYLMEYKIRWTSRGYDTPIINRVFCKKIADQFGGRLKYVLVSSATLHPRTQAMVKAALNVNIVQAYGSTEVTGGANVLPMTDLSYGTCGIPYHSIKFYLKDWTEGGYSSKDIPNPRGEIVIGGDSLTEGYYKLPDETKDAFFTDEDDGTRWFKSGDIGEVLPNGSIKIIDRKKDLTKLANGEFVSLGKIESGLRNSRYVENICICTDPYRNHVTALISPNRRALADLVKTLSKSHLTFEGQCSDPEVTAHVLDSLRQLGKELGLASKEIPVAIRLVSEEWSPDNNLLTAAFKMKRKQVYDFYRVQIDQMFNNAQVK